MCPLQVGEHQLLVSYQTVRPENVHTGNTIWTQQFIFRNTYVFRNTCVCSITSDQNRHHEFEEEWGMYIREGKEEEMV